MSCSSVSPGHRNQLWGGCGSWQQGTALASRKWGGRIHRNQEHPLVQAHIQAIAYMSRTLIEPQQRYLGLSRLVRGLWHKSTN